MPHARALRLSLVTILLAASLLAIFSVQTVRAATVTVTTTADIIDAPGCAQDGITPPCSLRDAILFANTNPGTTIFLPAGIYTLAIFPSSNDDATTGNLNLTANVTILGAGADRTVIDGNFLDNVLSIAGGIVADISGLTVRHGQLFSGGGVFNDGTLTLTNVVVTNNDGTISGGTGGGIENFASLTLVGSTISNNFVPGGGGAGIDNGGVMQIVNSLITGNRTTGGGYGGGIANGGQATVTKSIVNSNASASGGGIAMFGGTLAIVSSIVAGNVANNETRFGFFSGGGVFVAGGVLTLTNSTINANVVNGTDTRTDRGGGIALTGGMTTATNTTISGNSAPDGGEVYISDLGSAAMTNVTITGDTTGIVSDALPGPAITLNNSLIANLGANCTGSPVEGPSSDHNLDSGHTCGFNRPHDLSNANPVIGPLADNGGPTQTHALLPVSPAIDAGGTAADGCPAMDQRGVSRPHGTACDIGAYEYVPPPPTISGISPDFGGVEGGTAVTITGTNFRAGAMVSFGGVPSPSVTVVSATQVTAITPAHAATPVLVVMTYSDGASATPAGAFDYKLRPGPIAPGGPPGPLPASPRSPPMPPSGPTPVPVPASR